MQQLQQEDLDDLSPEEFGKVVCQILRQPPSRPISGNDASANAQTTALDERGPSVNSFPDENAGEDVKLTLPNSKLTSPGSHLFGLRPMLRWIVRIWQSR